VTKWTLAYKPSGVFILAEEPPSETFGVSGGSVTVRKSTRTARRRAPTAKRTARLLSCRQSKYPSHVHPTTPLATFAELYERLENVERKKSR